MKNSVYDKRGNAASNSYTLHTATDNGNQTVLDRLIKTGVTISPQDYAQLTHDILESMFRGNITFKCSASGMQTMCFLHFFGDTLVSAQAKGCGYAVQSESVRLALVKLQKVVTDPHNVKLVASLLSNFKDGYNWERNFETCGIFAAHIGG